jgi:hypothetical protein
MCVSAREARNENALLRVNGVDGRRGKGNYLDEIYVGKELKITPICIKSNFQFKCFKFNAQKELEFMCKCVPIDERKKLEILQKFLEYQGMLTIKKGKEFNDPIVDAPGKRWFLLKKHLYFIPNQEYGFIVTNIDYDQGYGDFYNILVTLEPID